jgi:hypothetical protein
VDCSAVVVMVAVLDSVTGRDTNISFSCCLPAISISGGTNV